MEEGDVLVFNPASEFQVLEEFEFDEMIQRPEETRFYTLNEQTNDFLEKLLPQSGKKVPKATLKKAEEQVDAFKLLYNKYLKESESGFEQMGSDRPVKLPWVTYAYNKEPAITTYVWSHKWTPLFSGLQPNYYLSMLDSLPKSALYYPEAEGRVVFDNIVNGRKVLGPYTYTKTAYREDGTYTISKIPRPDTEDVATFSGYTIGVPNPAPPNPLADHPFLGLRAEPITIESTEALPVLLPSVEAILQHAVPRTSNPYKDAPPYLNLYDLALEDIPWNLWKEVFPPMELIEEGAPPVEIAPRKSAEDAPAKALIDVYKTAWYPGLSTRRWLANQLDAGTLVSKILLSRVGSQAPIAVPPPVLLPDLGPIDGTPEDCLPSVVTQFSDFAVRGVFRSNKCFVCGWAGHGATECPDLKGRPTKEYKPGGGCLPLAFVTNERSEMPYKNRLPWIPGTDTAILQEYQQYISKYTEKFIDIIAAVPKAEASLGLSETREYILEILSDESRTPEDRAVDILAIIHDTEHTIDKNVYKEETGQFLICEHTLDQLSGSYETEPRAFLKRWTVNDKGFSVCRSCGEPVAGVLEAQDEFDESGRLVQYRSKIEKATFNPTEHTTFAASLKQLQSTLDLGEPAEDILYLLLSLLQILPEEDQLKPVLDYARSESAKVNAKIAGKKLTAKQKSDVDLALAVFGFNAVVILMQTHRPQLLPRRSFGGKPMILRGFPRDTADSADAPIVDSLIRVLTNTFEQYPSTFKGASVVLLRTLLNDKKGVRKVVINSLTKQFVPVFAKRLQEARDNVETVDVKYVLRNSFSPPIVNPGARVLFLAPSDKISTKDHPRFRCTDSQLTWLTSSTAFSFRQKEIQIVTPLRASVKARVVTPFHTDIEDYIPTSDEVRARIKLKVPEIAFVKKIVASDSPELLRSILLEWMNVVASTTTAAPAVKEYIRAVRTPVEQAIGDPSMLRDYFKGVLVELSGRALVDPTVKANLERSLSDNLSIRSLLTKIDESKKVIDTLRAKEREAFKARMRSMPDAQREITKTLIDRGLAPYLITKEDREMFMNELAQEMEAPPLILPVGEEGAEGDIPDEGLNDERDDGPQGEVPVNADGTELLTDHGDYGDRRARSAEGEEYVDEGDNGGDGF